MPERLLHRRLVAVTGKGGVGKSTVAAALGVLAARQGRRTVIAEVGRRDDVAAMLRPTDEQQFAPRPPTDHDRFDEHRLTLRSPGATPDAVTDPQLWHVSVSPEAALREYLHDQLPLGPLAGVLGSSRLFTGLTAAAPGMRELLAMGKVWELSQPTRRTPDATPYDLCVMDAPASGHATTVLSAPAQFAATAKVGPVARQGQKIAATIADPEQTAVVIVAAPEELAVSEALELQDELHERVGVGAVLAVVNGMLPERFTAEEQTALEAHAAEVTDHAVVTASLYAQRAADQQRQLARLRAGFTGPVIALPAVATRRLGPDDVGALADRLEAELRRVASDGGISR